MPKRDWKKYRACSLLDALRACKDYALERHGRTVARIGDHMGQTEDSLYKWLATGRLPTILIPAYEMACGAHFVSDWLAASAGRMVIPMPTGRKASEQDLLQVSADCAAAMQQLAAFYANPASCDTAALMDALHKHLEQVAFHHKNVSCYEAPELDFTA